MYIYKYIYICMHTVHSTWEQIPSVLLPVNPLRPSGENCSDLAEIFSMTSFNL